RLRSLKLAEPRLDSFQRGASRFLLPLASRPREERLDLAQPLDESGFLARGRAPGSALSSCAAVRGQSISSPKPCRLSDSDLSRREPVFRKAPERQPVRSRARIRPAGRNVSVEDHFLRG